MDTKYYYTTSTDSDPRYSSLYESYEEAEDEARVRAFRTGEDQLIFESIAVAARPAAVNDVQVSKL